MKELLLRYIEVGRPMKGSILILLHFKLVIKARLAIVPRVVGAERHLERVESMTCRIVMTVRVDRTVLGSDAATGGTS